MDNNPQLDDWLDLDAPMPASLALKARIHAISSIPQVPDIFIAWTLRNLTAYTVLFAFLTCMGSWAGQTSLGGIVHVQEHIDAFLVEALLGTPTFSGELL